MNKQLDILNEITDHPRIAINDSEHQRVSNNLNYYMNRYPAVKYVNVYNKHKHRDFKPLNITKTACRRLASVIFNEQCSITVSANDGNSNLTAKVQTFIDDVLDTNDFKNRFEEELEKGIALGNLVARPYVDREDNQIKISWIRADQFYPLQVNVNKITSLAIAHHSSVIDANNQIKYYTLLEFHYWNQGTYVIDNELYSSNNPNIVGERVDLAEQYPNLDARVVYDNFKYPLFAIFKTPGANNKDLSSPLGVGVIDNAKEVLDEINQAHDQYMRDIELGKRKMVIPEQMLKYDDKHQPYFDEIEEGYVGLSSNQQGFKVEDITLDIRTDTYNNVLDRLIKEFEVQIGLSVGTFSNAENPGTITATQVVTDNERTYQTRSSYLTKVEHLFKELIRSILQLAIASEEFSDGQGLLDITVDDIQALDIAVQFDDGVFIDQKSKVDLYVELLNNKLIPNWYAIMKINNITEEDAREWAGEIADSEIGPLPPIGALDSSNVLPSQPAVNDNQPDVQNAEDNAS